MLPAVTLVAQWRDLQQGLSADWGDARLQITFGDERPAARGAALLGPAMPARRGCEVRFYSARRGAGISPGALERLLARLDAEGIGGKLELRAVDEPTEQQPETHRATLAATWEALLESLPPDWSDVYGEIELESSDWLDRAALLLSPLNPSRYGGLPGYRFRVSRRFGYGTSATMARRAFERLDEERIRGELRILYALSDTQPVGTQGPVFRLEGRAV
jgi:hypothetical protein